MYATKFLFIVAAAQSPFDYHSHGADWPEVCTIGRQSPIDFPSGLLTAPEIGKFTYRYKRLTEMVELQNNGHAIFFDVGGRELGGISYARSWYSILNIALHTKSEHTVDGKHYPLEIHILHQKWDSPEFLIVAIPVTDEMLQPPTSFLQVPDQSFQREMDTLLKDPLPAVGQTVAAMFTNVVPLDLNAWLDGTFLEYAGSLTVPPCAGDVVWLVRREPLRASGDQVGVMTQALRELSAGYGNYRATQPLGDRIVSIRRSMREDPMPNWPEKVPTSEAVNPAASRVYRAMRETKDALKISKASSRYISDLDRRIQAAAVAHAKAYGALEPPTAPPPLEPVVLDVPAMVKEALNGAIAEADRASASAVVSEKSGFGHGDGSTKSLEFPVNSTVSDSPPALGLNGTNTSVPGNVTSMGNTSIGASANTTNTSF